MQANNRSVKDWLVDVESGALQLPRFQRQEAWNDVQIEAFLKASVLTDRPTGIMITLNVNPNEPPFKTRGLDGVAIQNAVCTRHLLDGQQRLTALWKGTQDKYPEVKYFLKFVEKEGQLKFLDLVGESKVGSSDWIDNPKEQYSRGLVPLALFSPTVGFSKANAWIRSLGMDDEQTLGLYEGIHDLRATFSAKDIAYFDLPEETVPEDAVDIFIRANT